jgi:2,4-dienoyl-CoA reductase-like NADH-dependent reductase (Old Yellow Enzyme family)
MLRLALWQSRKIVATPELFSPLTLRGLILKNRIVLSPMCQYLAVDGLMQDWHFAHHSRFALSGLGLAFIEATAVQRDGRITHGCTGLWDDGQIAGMKRIVELYHAHGTPVGLQIGHSGRRGSAHRPWEGAHPIGPEEKLEPAWPTVGPSALPEKPGSPVPRELNTTELEVLTHDFVATAQRALAAGFDVLEIHGAHGYLIHSFVSPISNQRNDGYGGTPEKRMRLPLEIVEAVRRVWPETKPLFYRVSAVDNVVGGLSLNETARLAAQLKERGVDVIDCSSGGMSGPATLSSAKIRPGYQVPYAEAIKRDAKIRTMAVGAILDGPQAETIISRGLADLVAVGREMLADPNWAFHAAEALSVADPYAVLPRYYAFYLERRAKVLER